MRADMTFDQLIRSGVTIDSLYQRLKTRGQFPRDSLLVEGPIGRITQGADLVALNCITIYGCSNNRLVLKRCVNRRGSSLFRSIVISPVRQAQSESENQTGSQRRP